MNVVSSGISLYCTDNVNTYEIIVQDFNESVDEITVLSQFKNENLNRGWLGDIKYITLRNQSFKFSDENRNSFSDGWKDVLLASVRLTCSYDSANTWEYRFLKR